jgi:cell division protein ZapA
MPVVNIKIRDSLYPIACDAGQEEKLQQIAARLDTRVSALATNLGKANDMQLLIMTALMMEDQVSELKKGMYEQHEATNSDNAISETIEAIADYIENLAKSLEKA